MKSLKTKCSRAAGCKDYAASYFLHLSELLTSLDSNAINGVIDCFLKARKNKKTIYFIGNGGSAATASHFAQDLGEVGRKAKTSGFKSLSLTDNISLISAAANDHGYDKIFTVQLEELFSPGDVLVAISASGNSPNVVNAVEFANKAGGVTIGFIGFSGGKLKDICDQVIHVKTPVGEYGPVEDVHLIMDHLIQSYLVSMLSAR